MVSIFIKENFMYKKLNYILKAIILFAGEILYNKVGGGNYEKNFINNFVYFCGYYFRM